MTCCAGVKQGDDRCLVPRIYSLRTLAVTREHPKLGPFRFEDLCHCFNLFFRIGTNLTVKLRHARSPEFEANGGNCRLDLHLRARPSALVKKAIQISKRVNGYFSTE